MIIGRDIVQFVIMRDIPTGETRDYLSKVVMEEIPDQFIHYMEENNIRPK